MLKIGRNEAHAMTRMTRVHICRSKGQTLAGEGNFGAAMLVCFTGI